MKLKKAQNLIDFVPQWLNQVESKGFEPMTSALSKQRSKPAELRFLFVLAKIGNLRGFQNLKGLNKTLSYIFRSVISIFPCQILRRTGKGKMTSFVSSFRTQVNHPIGGFDDFGIVLDDDN